MQIRNGTQRDATGRNTRRNGTQRDAIRDATDATGRNGTDATGRNMKDYIIDYCLIK